MAPNSTAPKVLFVSHDASRTGAPLSLLEIVRHSRQAYDWDIRVLIGAHGEMDAAYREAAPCDFVEGPLGLAPVQDVPLPPIGLPFLARRLTWRFREEGLSGFVKNIGQTVATARRDYPRQWSNRNLLLEQRALSKDLLGWKPDLLYLNTVVSLRIARALGLLDLPSVLHVREYEMAFDLLMTPQDHADLVAFPAHYLAVSQVVKTFLLARYGIADDRVTLAHAGVDPLVLERRADELSREAVSRELGFSDDTRVIAASGSLGFVKGPDLFIEMAHALLSDPDIRVPLGFVWVGGKEGEVSVMRRWVGMKGLEDRVKFIGAKANPYPIFRRADVFAMCSRNEPFGRVTMEAGYLKTPVVYFAGAGGSQDVVGPDGGLAVEGSSLPGFCACVKRLIGDDALREGMGDAAHRYIARHHLHEEQARAVGQVIERMLDDKAPATSR